jgi:Beta-propeller repeat
MKHSGRVRRAIAPKLDWMGGLTLMFRLTKQFFAASLPLAAIATFDSAALATEAKSQAVVSQKLPLLFFENRGQLDSRVQFAGRRGGLATYFTKDSFVVDCSEAGQTVMGETAYRGATLRYTFEGASADAKLVGEEPNDARFNFIKGTQPEKWVTDVPSFGVVRYQSLYPGVDLVVRDANGTLEYDLVLAPGASLDQVRIRCEGADRLGIDSEGSLVASTKWGDLKQKFPQTWEVGADGSRQAIDSKFVMLGDDSYGFAAPDRTEGSAIVVDPGLTYSSFIGGTNTEHGCGVSVDEQCALFIAGDTKSVDFPVWPGSYDLTHNGDVDTFCSKVDATGGKLVYSTFLGGALGDFGHGVIVDNKGQAHITGGTKSIDFPITAGAFQSIQMGEGDVFVTKLNDKGTGLVYSTFVGGTGDEGSLGGQGIAVDSTGAVYVTGFTGSADYPVTAGVYQSALAGVVDVFCTKVSPDGSALAYSTYIGGANLDIANAIDIDAAGNAYCGGWSISNDYPTTPGAFETVPNGNSNGVMSRLNATGSALDWSSYTGGSSDVVRGVAVEGQEAYVAGYTLSSVYPATAGAIQTGPGGNGDAFLMRFNATGTGVFYATYLGGIEVDVANNLDTDINGSAYLTGWTESSNFPVTASIAYDSTYNGAQDAFITRVSGDGAILEYSSFFGGTGYDVGFAMNVHEVGSFYMAGGSFSADLPTTPGSLDTTYNGNEDIYMVLMPAGPNSCPNPASSGVYGPSEIDSNGYQPSLVATTLPKVPSHALNISLTGAAPNSATFMVIGKSPLAMFFDQGTLLVLPTFVVNVGLTDGTGSLLLSTPVLDNPNFCDDHVYLQALVNDRDATSLFKLTTSNGVHLHFGF